MRKRASILVFVFLLTTSCYHHAGVKLRANEFYQSLAQKNYGNLWEMATPDSKEDYTKDKYVEAMGSFFEPVKIGYKDIKVIEEKEKYAITTTILSLKGTGVDISECEKVLWIRRNNQWYFDKSGLKCDYEPTEEIKKIIESR